MRFSAARPLFLSAAFAVLSLAAAPVTHADQAFVCDDGRLIQANHQEVEQLKKTDACVAKHFGLNVVNEEAPPLPHRRPNTIETRGTTVELAHPASTPAPQLAAMTPKSGTTTETPNFRNVVIINAAPGASRVFHHRF